MRYILQVRERTQIEKCIWNLSCYIVEAQIPKNSKTILVLLLLLIIKLWARLSTILKCCSLGSSLKILPYSFFFQWMEVYFLS